MKIGCLVVQKPVVLHLCVVLVKGTLIAKQRMKGGLCMKGSFAGEWGKSVTMKNASLNGLFESPPDQRGTTAESQ